MQRTLKFQMAVGFAVTLMLGVSLGLYLAAAFIGPSITGN